MLVALRLLTRTLQALATDAEDDENNITAWRLDHDQQVQMAEEVGNGFAALFTSFNMMFMGGLDIKLLDHAYSPLLAKLIYVYYVVIVPLIMLNLLIALMGNEHQKIDAAEEYEGQRCDASAYASVLLYPFPTDDNLM